jgi:hypothetical protein
MITSFYNFGVPFFFAVSGFFFFKKVESLNKNEKYLYYKKFTKRILKMYAVWSLIYFIFVVTNWIQNGVNIATIAKYFHTALVFTTYGTIWFLPALWIGTSIMFYLRYNGVKYSNIIILSIVLYIIGSLGYSYIKLIEGTEIYGFYEFYDLMFVTTRNGLFAGFPFVAIGAFVSVNKFDFGKFGNFILVIMFSMLYVVEAFFIKYNYATNVDMGLLLVPSIFFILIWLENINLKPRPIYIKLRNFSMLIFLGQRLFITAIPSVLPSQYMETISANNYVGLIIFVSQIMLFAILVESFSKKYTWLKVLW